MASIISKNVFTAGRVLSKSQMVAPKVSQYTRSISYNNKIEFATTKPMTFSRNFATESKPEAKNEDKPDSKAEAKDEKKSESKPAAGKDHLKEGLPEQFEWTADHLEKYLRNFAASKNYKQADVDHLIKTFVSGTTSAKDFFNLDKESLAAKIGKENPERTKMANDLVAEVWKETEAVGRKMQSYGTMLVGAAAVIMGVMGYNYVTGDKKEDKNAKNAKDAKDAKNAKDAKDEKNAKNAKDAKDEKNAKDAKDHSKDSKDSKSTKVVSDDDKKKAAQAFKEDGAVGKQFTEKGAIGGAAQKVGGPLDKDGSVGKQFTKDGAIGGAVQKKAEEKEEEYKNKSKK